MFDKTDSVEKSKHFQIEMDQLEEQDNKAVMARSREYDQAKKKHAQEHWSNELQQKVKFKGDVVRGNDIVTKLK